MQLKVDRQFIIYPMSVFVVIFLRNTRQSIVLVIFDICLFNHELLFWNIGMAMF